MQSTLKNRTIFCRDNLEILRGIDSDTIDLVYLDPPFNKKKDLRAPIGTSAEGASFRDIWQMKDTKNEWHGMLAEQHPRLYDFLSGVENLGDRSNKYYLIYIAIRLLEVHRVLKKNGSLYLHCDQTMSHHIKLLLDSIFGHGDFGKEGFRNEIIWCYSQGSRGGKATSKQFAGNHDIILFYSKGRAWMYKNITIEHPLTEEEAEDKGYKKDNTGKWFKTAPRGNYTDESMKKLEREGRVHKTRNNKLRVKYYAEVRQGKIIDTVTAGDSWFDIPDMMHVPKNERTGYPTQKPIKLLERIIESATEKGDLILDPFCGCATTCVAAERLGRRWVGIDISDTAFNLVKTRLGKEINWDESMFSKNKVIYREDIPHRTDHSIVGYGKIDKKHILYGQQEGKCKGCGQNFEYRHMTLDHLVPKDKGGADDIENLQLLCGHCNSVQGNRDMAYLLSRLKELKFIS